jgi:hypothetical protein
MNIELTEFSLRHFDKTFGGTYIDMTSEEFINILNQSSYNVLDGYAGFCKLVVVQNFTNAKTGTMKIDLTTLPYLKSGYSSRRPEELAVLSQWLEIPKRFVPKAEYLVVVVYSKQQLAKEGTIIDTGWGVVAILGQMCDSEEPMKPITMMRNALGIEEGGSDVKLDREAYEKSVKFWSENATVKIV